MTKLLHSLLAIAVLMHTVWGCSLHAAHGEGRQPGRLASAPAKHAHGCTGHASHEDEPSPESAPSAPRAPCDGPCCALQAPAMAVKSAEKTALAETAAIVWFLPAQSEAIASDGAAGQVASVAPARPPGRLHWLLRALRI